MRSAADPATTQITIDAYTSASVRRRKWLGLKFVGRADSPRYSKVQTLTELWSSKKARANRSRRRKKANSAKCFSLRRERICSGHANILVSPAVIEQVAILIGNESFHKHHVGKLPYLFPFEFPVQKAAPRNGKPACRRPRCKPNTIPSVVRTGGGPGSTTRESNFPGRLGNTG